MAFLSTSHHCISTSVFPKTTPSLSFHSPKTTPSSLSFPTRRTTLFFRARSIPFFQVPDVGNINSDGPGEKGPDTKYPETADSDTPMIEEEEKEEEFSEPVDFSLPAEEGPMEEDEVGDLKRSLVEAFYATEFGLRDNTEVRAEVSELVNKLETLNPNPSPVDVPLFDGTWVLLYTAFSELLPLLALSSIPLLKVEKISQKIDSSNLSIVNSTTFSSPFATVSFSASATFEVRSPSRIQVQFKEGSFEPPEIKSSISLPENVDIFGQTVNLSPLQQSLNPLQEAVANVSRIISGQPSLKVPIRGNGSRSWLLTTYLDKDLRISRGDGGLFILAKEGSPLLDLAG